MNTEDVSTKKWRAKPVRDSIRINVVLPQSTYTALATLCHHQQRPMSNMVRFIIEKFMEKNT
ncbi:MAG: hypothetical protein JW395_3345 [Nitrospira sp.]|nr:hypothetical protein [Nitrospira sp.]